MLENEEKIYIGGIVLAFIVFLWALFSVYDSSRRDGLDNIAGELRDAGQHVDTARDRVDSGANRVSRIERSVSTSEELVNELSSDIDEVERNNAVNEERVKYAETRVDGIERRLAHLQAGVNTSRLLSEQCRNIFAKYKTQNAPSPMAEDTVANSMCRSNGSNN